MAAKDDRVFEEDSYSVIFSALKHPVRRHILRIISGEPTTYTEILKALGVESPYLTYHLDSLKPLISKTNAGKYVLSSFGRAAFILMRGVKKPIRYAQSSNKLSIRRILLFIPLLLFLITCSILTGLIIHSIFILPY